MAVLNKGHDFSDGDQVTAAKLDNAVDAATFAAGAVDNASTQLSGGAIIVKDAGVTAAKIANKTIILDKIQNISPGYVLGKGHGQSTGSPQEILIDNDLLSVNTNHNTVVSAKAVKDYVDNGGSSLITSGYQYLPSGLLMQWGTTSFNSADGASGTIRSFPIAFPTACFSITANDYGAGANSVSIVASSVSQLTCWGKNSTGAYTTTVIKYIAIGH